MTESTRQFHFPWECLLWSCAAISTSSRQNVKFGDPQVKTSLKALDISSISEAASGPPLVGQTGIWISKKNPSPGRGVRPWDKKISPISLQHKNLGRKSSLWPLEIGLLKWNSGAALSSVSTTFFSHFNCLGQISCSFYSVLSKEYLLLLSFYHVMLASSSKVVSCDALAI